MFSGEKDPGADLDFSIDWTAWLASGETIATSTWTVQSGSGLTMHNDGRDSAHKIATVWLSGGNPSNGTPWLVTNTIVTSNSPARTNLRSILLTVRPE